MPGSSPATPNLSMDLCQRQATSKQSNSTYVGKYAAYINDWCTKYDEVLPCIDRVLPSANSASDWFLKLIYDQPLATRMSKSVCARFPFLSDLKCVEKDMALVGKCMQWTTKSAIDRFFGQFVPNEPLTSQKKKMASIYACIISVATAGCFHKQLTSCSKPQRKLMYDFNIMMSGNCREIAGIPETTTQEMMTTTLEILSTTPTTSLPKNDSVVENVDESLSDNNSTLILPEVPVQNSTSSNTHAEYRRNGAKTIVIDIFTVIILLIAYTSFIN